MYYTLYIMDGTRLVTNDFRIPSVGDSPWAEVRTVEGERIIVNMCKVLYVKASEIYQQPKNQTSEVVEATLRGIGLIRDEPIVDLGEHVDAEV